MCHDRVREQRAKHDFHKLHRVGKLDSLPRKAQNWRGIGCIAMPLRRIHVRIMACCALSRHAGSVGTAVAMQLSRWVGYCRMLCDNSPADMMQPGLPLAGLLCV